MGIKAVFFDMGGTLERVWQTFEARLEAALDLKQILLAGGIDLNLNDREFYELVVAGYHRYHDWSIESMEELPSCACLA